MKIKLIKDNFNRMLFLKFELKKKLLKSISYNQHIDKSLQLIAQTNLDKHIKNSSITRIHNRCTKTGRSRGVYRDFKLSRISLRLSCLNGDFPGITKSSW